MSEPVRSYDHSAMNDLVERSRDYHDRGEHDMVETDYLIAALEHYRQAYTAAQKHEEQLSTAIHAVRNATANIVRAIDQLDA